ncbi:MAG: polyprenyl synthetase family protein [Kiritimatiellae bacterium]|nr:polyprenyl synthetase family protein [Kiritimatiellia bacterium]MDD5522122.1 polyprenyl synthetase family protein [Kiritimatiellia bacterium]
MRMNEKNIKETISRVRDVMADCLRKTSLGSIADELVGIAGGGKMLRVRMMFRIGAVTGISRDNLLRSAATIEMLHAASLLHDDVIDGAVLRRGLPAFWITKGTSGSILLGDLLVCQAFKLVSGVESGKLLPMLITLANEVCDAEAQQELLLKGEMPDWSTCVSIARRKTGALFAFTGYASGGNNTELCNALKNAGYAVGTAYQLADDFFDAYGDPDLAGKTLGSDAKSGKITAASAWRSSNIDPQVYISDLLADSEKMLVAWPDVADAWRDYLKNDLQPVIDSFLSSFPVQTV